MRERAQYTYLFILAVILCGIDGFDISLAAQENRPQGVRQSSIADSIEQIQIHELQEDLSVLFNDPQFKEASKSITITSLTTGETLFAHNADALMTPASTVKLFTTAAALEYLGEDFRYSTSLFLDGEIGKSGDYKGNLFIRAAGDPTMSNYFYNAPLEILERWVDTLEILGIRSIHGNLIADDTYFDDTPWGPGWAWDDFPYPYSAEVSALSFNDNKVDVFIRPGATEGKSAVVSVFPPNSYITIRNTVTTIASDSIGEIVPLRLPNSNIFELSGSIPFDSTELRPPVIISLAVENPTLFSLHLLKQAITNRGIAFRGGVLNSRQWGEDIRYTELLPVCHQTSPALAMIIKAVNSESHNLCAEALFKTIAKEKTGTGGFAQGSDIITRFAGTHGIQPEDFVLLDGSGLSRLNLLSSRQIVRLLIAEYYTPTSSAFFASLAAPGKPGTLRLRMRNTRAERNVRAKTGSMNNTCNIAGYVVSRDSETLAFAIMFNNFIAPQSVVRNLQDLVCMRLASFSRKKSQ